MNKIDRLSKQLLKVKERFDMWKNSGLNEEILVVWLHHKTGLSIKKVKELLEDQQKFFDELIKTEVVKRLDEA